MLTKQAALLTEYSSILVEESGPTLQGIVQEVGVYPRMGWVRVWYWWWLWWSPQTP